MKMITKYIDITCVKLSKEDYFEYEQEHRY